MIELGLQRIARLVAGKALRWKAIHVAGTNGKGSICAYMSAMLNQDYTTGRFTSPHLVDRWDCVSVGEQSVTGRQFLAAEKVVEERNGSQQVGATEFEVLTATAFDLFTQNKVDIAAVEVGLGGRLDATNVLQAPDVLCSVISKIGLDHQSFLGDTIEEIAREKAGILKSGVPCVVDNTNEPAVLDVIRSVASDVGAGPLHFISELPESLHKSFYETYPKLRSAPQHVKTNIACAYQAVEQSVLRLNNNKVDAQHLLNIIPKVTWPARLHQISIQDLTQREEKVILDGAHNVQSAEALAAFVNPQRKTVEFGQVTWVLAASEGKDISGIMNHLLKPGDHVIAVEFGPVDHMPWVKPMPAGEVLKKAREHGASEKSHALGRDLLWALRSATHLAAGGPFGVHGGPLVIAGSLYLAGDVLRLKRDAALSSCW